jgi:hypothetical protein
MVRKIIAVAALAVVVACVSAKEYVGKMTKIDEDKKTVTVKVDDKDHVFSFSDKTEFIKGKDGSSIPHEFLSKLGERAAEKGIPTTVTTAEKDGKEVEKDGHAVATKFLLGKKK